MCVRRPRGVGVQHIGVFGGKKLLQVEIAIRDIPTEGSCGPHPELVGDRWWNIMDWEEGSLESFDIRIHDPANPKIPTEATEGGRVYPPVCIGASVHQGSEVGDSIS